MRVVQETWLAELQTLITNRLDVDALHGKRVGGILGDAPSTYARSPRLWNAAFRALGLEAVYVPLDVPQGRLRDVIQALRASEAFLGGSVTVPYKAAVIPLLDEIDPLAAQIGAVNVIARTPEGRLIGSNTDGLGGLRALIAPIVPGSHPCMPELAQARVLLLGAGGAAQAVAFTFWKQMTQGELVVANRTRANAEALAQRLASMRAGQVRAIAEDAVPHEAPKMDLILNATVKGQGGIRTLADGCWTCLEPFSALAPASPEPLAPLPGEGRAFLEAWYRTSLTAIQRNQQRSLEVCGTLPRTTVCYDIIYAPLESVFLRHARWSGHPTLNGKAMNIVQAVEAFVRYVCRDWLAQLGFEDSQAYARVGQAMAEEWAK